MECERAPVVSVPTVCCLSSQPTIVGASFFQEPIINGQYMAPDIVLSNEMVFKLFCDYLVLFEKYKNKLNGLGHFTRPEWDELVEARAQLRYHYEIEKYGYLKIIPPKEMTPEAIKDYFASFPAPKEFEHITVVQDQDAPRFGKS